VATTCRLYLFSIFLFFSSYIFFPLSAPHWEGDAPRAQKSGSVAAALQQCAIGG